MVLGLASRAWSWFTGMIESPIMRMGDLGAFLDWNPWKATKGKSSVHKAMQIATVHACVKVLTESVASLPCSLRRQGDDSSDVVEKKHVLHRFFHDMSGELTPFDVFEWAVASMLFTGKAAFQKRYNQVGDLIEVVPLYPELLKHDPDTRGKYIYHVPGGEPATVNRGELWLTNYFLGLSPLALARRQLAEAEGIEEHGKAFFDNDASPGGVIVAPGTLKPEQRKSIIRNWNDDHAGASKAFRIGLLDGGMDFRPFSINHEEAQFLDLRRFSREEISAIYRVPLIFINDLTHAHYNNAEHMDLAFVKHTLGPLTRRLVQSMNRDFLTQDERDAGLNFGFKFNALMRGDYKSRMEGYSKATAGGVWFTSNEIRGWEGLPPLEGGDVLRFPLNTAKDTGGEDDEKND